jgi:hypothetical protein
MMSFKVRSNNTIGSSPRLQQTRCQGSWTVLRNQESFYRQTRHQTMRVCSMRNADAGVGKVTCAMWDVRSKLQIFTAFSMYRLERLKMYTTEAVRPTQT